MANYKVAVSETSVRVLEVKAQSLEDALRIVKDDYNAGFIVLDAEDFMDVTFWAQDEYGREMEV